MLTSSLLLDADTSIFLQINIHNIIGTAESVFTSNKPVIMMAIPIPGIGLGSYDTVNQRTGPTQLIVVGLGSELLYDGGVGIHAIKQLQPDLDDGIAHVILTAYGIHDISAFEYAERILAIDAVQAGGEPGTVYAFSPNNHSESAAYGSLHESDLFTVFKFLPHKPRPEIVLLGVEPGSIKYGVGLSSPVRAALPQVIRTAREIVKGWKKHKA